MTHTITKECRLYVCKRHQVTFCAEHDAWMSDPCADSCLFCYGRPEKPSSRASSMLDRPELYGDRSVESTYRSEDSESSSE